MKKLLLAMSCVAALLWGGCSDSDDDPAVDQDRLIGKWEQYKEYDGEYDEWGYLDEDESYVLEFREDDICVATEDGYWSREFRYWLDSNRLFLTYSVYNETKECRIDRLTASELVLAVDYVGENGKNCTDKEFYRRIE